MSAIDVERLLKPHYRKSCPDDPRYQARLQEEYQLIAQFGFAKTFLQVREILDLTQDLPHLTRGSAGSSLVGYLLGIHEIDPIKEGIALTRFMHEYRPDLPDIDLDFAWYDQSEAHRRVLAHWGPCAARVSNHITYQESSALREAVRRLGYHKQLPRKFNLREIVPGREDEALRVASELLGSVRGISLHCGGVIIRDEPFTADELVAPDQLKYDKREVEAKGWLKVDILSNRGLGQLHEIESVLQRPLLSYPETDAATCALLCRGDTIGVTQAESPAFRKMLRALQPRSRADVILAMALIRPAAASRGRKSAFFADWEMKRSSDTLVYEEDAITLACTSVGCSPAEGDLYRRAFSKGKEDKIAEFAARLGEHPKRSQILDDMSQMREYSLCKAHAISYGRMVWALAYQKTHNPKLFWKSALNNCQSMYASWVHTEEAKNAGWELEWGRPPFKAEGNKLVSTRDLQLEQKQDGFWQFRRRGIWTSPRFFPTCMEQRNGDEVRFRGLVATARTISRDNTPVTFVTLGTGRGRYLDVVLQGAVEIEHHIIEGVGYTKEAYRSEWVDVWEYQQVPMELVEAQYHKTKAYRGTP